MLIILKKEKKTVNIQFCISLNFTQFIQLQLHSRFAGMHVNDALKPCLEMYPGNVTLHDPTSEPRKAHREEIRFHVKRADPHHHLLTNSGGL